MRVFLLAALFLLFQIFFLRREAAGDEGLSPPFHLAFGGAGSASLKEGFSYLLNPAALGFHRKSKSAAAYTTKNGKQIGALSFMDLSAGLPLSLTYSRFWSSRFLKSDEDHLSVSAGGLTASWLSLGITVHRVRYRAEKGKTLWNGDIGSLLRLGESAGLSFTLRRLLVNEKGNRRKGTVGLYLRKAPAFQGYMDVSHSKAERWLLRGGAETIFQKFLAIRGGASWSVKKKRGLVSGGIAFYGPRLQMDYSLEKDRRIWQHAFAAKLIF